jgi:L-alanine-DL-glutamate epimerase-like enolase superfamily enzyme
VADARVITNVEVHPASYLGPFQPPRRRSFALIAVTTDDGSTGWGEASDCYGHTHPLTVKSVVDEDLRWFLTGKPIEPMEDLIGSLRRRIYPFLGARELAMQAISGIEIALWDLRGKAAGQPISGLLGRRRDRVPVYASGMLAFHLDPEEYVRSFDLALSRGVRTVKIRVGRDLDWDTNWVRSLRALVPDHVEMLVDGKYNYTAAGATTMAAVLSELGMIAFEEPMLDTDLEAIGDVAGKVAVPFAYGEHAFTVNDFRELVHHRAATILEPDVTVCGGFTEGMRIARLADESGCRIMAHCGGLSAIGLAANLHYVAALADPMPLEYDIQPVQPLRDELLVPGSIFGPETFVDGALAVPSGPGLGIDVDTDGLAKFPYEIDKLIASSPTEYASPHI